MKTVQERLDMRLSKGNSIAWWAMGFYVEPGGPHGFNLNIPIFGYKEQSQFNTMVLIDFLGSMMWINCKPEHVFYGWGGKDAPSPKGKELRRKLEAIKCNN